MWALLQRTLKGVLQYGILVGVMSALSLDVVDVSIVAGGSTPSASIVCMDGLGTGVARRGKQARQATRGQMTSPCVLGVRSWAVGGVVLGLGYRANKEENSPVMPRTCECFVAV